MAKVRIKQIKSMIKKPEVQKITLKALGLGKINRIKEVEATPQILGMINRVKHLVTVEEV